MIRSHPRGERIRCKPLHRWKLCKLRSRTHDPSSMARERGGEYLHFSARQAPHVRCHFANRPPAPCETSTAAAALRFICHGTPGIPIRVTPWNPHRLPPEHARLVVCGLGSSSGTSHDAKSTAARMARQCLGGRLAGAGPVQERELQEGLVRWLLFS
jgi:hypothetical protein